MIDTQTQEATITATQIMLWQVSLYVIFFAVIIWSLRGKEIRRWFRRHKLSIPKEKDVRTINGPTWDVTWVKVSEAPEKHPDVQRTTVLGNTLPEVIETLKAKFGDEFDEKNLRSTTKQTYSDVLVGIPDSGR